MTAEHPGQVIAGMLVHLVFTPQEKGTISRTHLESQTSKVAKSDRRVGQEDHVRTGMGKCRTRRARCRRKGAPVQTHRERVMKG